MLSLCVLSRLAWNTRPPPSLPLPLSPTNTTRATTERLSVVQEQTEFLAEEAESAKARESAAAGRAAAAEARAAGAKLDAETLERALRAEARRARGVEGEAANAREAEAAAEGLRERMEGLRERLEASETARCVYGCVCVDVILFSYGVRFFLGFFRLGKGSVWKPVDLFLFLVVCCLGSLETVLAGGGGGVLASMRGR